MEVQVTWSKAQLEAAANFISENNPHFKGQLKEIRRIISNYIVQLANNFPHQTGVGTMGFYIEAQQVEVEGIDGDENKILIEISVDPAVSKDIWSGKDTVKKTFQVDLSKR